MDLKSEITFKVARGGLYQLLVKLPKGKSWLVESVTVTPAGLLQSYSSTDQPLSVELRNGLGVGGQARVSVHLRSPWDSPGRPGGNLLDFPPKYLEPVHPGSREGDLQHRR